MEKVISLLKALGLTALAAVTYVALVVVLQSDWAGRYTMEDIGNGSLLFHVAPWLLIALAVLLPLLGVVAVLRKWLRGKLWRKLLAGSAVLVNLVVIVLLAREAGGEISFQSWSPAEPMPVEVHAEQAVEQVKATGTEPQSTTAKPSGEAIGGDAQQVANAPEDEQLVHEPELWHAGYLKKCIAVVEKYSAYVDKAKEMDAEMSRLKEVLVERLREGRIERDVVLDTADRVDALIDIHNEVMLPRYAHYKEERDKLQAMGNVPPDADNILWLTKLTEEINADTARVDQETAKVEDITAFMRQMINN